MVDDISRSMFSFGADLAPATFLPWPQIHATFLVPTRWSRGSESGECFMLRAPNLSKWKKESRVESEFTLPTTDSAPREILLQP